MDIAEPSEKKFWINSFLFSILVYSLLSLYQYFYYLMFSLIIANKVLALTAMILIGLSFAFSGIAHFFGFPDKLFVYRKYLGVTGFFYGLSHGLFSLYNYLFNSSATGIIFDFYHTWTVFGVKVSNVVAFAFGLSALLIFLGMALISNKKAIRKFGTRWRPMLRTGYIAYLFVIIHFSIKNISSWSYWFKNPGLPMLNLPVLLFSYCVIILRIALFISLKFKSVKLP